MDRGVGGLENWTIFMDAICVSSLMVYVPLNFFACRVRFSSNQDLEINFLTVL